jgi:hypothetical protein
MTDLVGLNTPATIMLGPKTVLERDAPQLLFVHHAGTLRAPGETANKDVIIANPQEIVSIETTGAFSNLQAAPLAALEYAKNNSFRAVFVRYGANDAAFSHLYLISPELNLELFLETLRVSMQEESSYFALSLRKVP